MTPRRTPASWIASLSGLALLGAALAVPASAEEPDPRTSAESGRRSGDAPAVDGGRGAGTAASVAPVERAELASAAARAARAPVVGEAIELPTSYPSQPQLRFYRDNPDDASYTAGLLGHPDLAPLLTEWMGESDRISTQVVGQSTGGRDLYLVTVTAPERTEDTARQSAWREEIRTDPVAAAADAELLGQYKTPVWISNNIHGNEWEGTDAAMKYIDYLVHAPLAEVGSILRNNRLYFSLSLNPDGRTLATRATSLGLDPNRDVITNTTPETRSFVRTAQAIQPIYSADFHGYTNVLQVEPCGPPHGSNYEYDVYLPHNYALALEVEQDVVAADIPGNTYYNVATGAVSATNTGPDTAHIKIPYRDTPTGWDDFPPIFTAQYAAFYGAATSTVELPLTRGAPAGRQTPARAVVNTEVARQTMESMVDYLNVPANARDMLRNQIEVFRRGVAGEPKTQVTTATIAGVPGPAQWKPLWDVADDQEPVTLPRAYVVPVGETQRSATDAAALVEQLLFHDIEVSRLTADATIGGTSYPVGSYVVDMHQPLRGLANSLLDLGEDISAKVPFMYDISGWSLAYLWGATVDKAGLTTDGPLASLEQVTAAAPVPGVPDDGFLTFDVAGVADVRALNALLEDDVAVSLLEDGSAVVGADDRAAVAAVSEEFDVPVAAATAADLAALTDEDTKGLTDLTIAYVGTQDDRLSLSELGFDDLVQVTAAAVNTAATNGTPTGLEDADVLWVGGAFTLAADSPGRTAVQALVDAGLSVVGRTNQAFAVASTYGLVSGTVVNGNSSGNGIVAVDTPADSVLAPYAQDASFIYPAFWFTGLGATTTVEQTYGAGNPLLAGHWRRGTSQGQPVANGAGDAAGQPAVVSGQTASGARALVFGTSVFFRTHPKGGLSQAARGLFWAGPAGPEVQAPSSPTVTLSADSPVTYPGALSFDVAVGADAVAPTGTVTILDEALVEVGSADLRAGTATVRVRGVRPGTTSYTAVYEPDSQAFEPASSDSVEVRVLKASSTTGLRVAKVGPRRFELTVTLGIRGVRSIGVVSLRDFAEPVGSMRFIGARTKKVTVSLPKGQHGLRAVFVGSPVAQPSRSASVRVRTG